MNWSGLPEMIPVFALTLAVGSWLALVMFVLWRNRRIMAEVRSLRQQSGFFDAVLLSERRYPIWIWSDGRVEASSAALSLLRLKGNVDALDDLVGDDASGLPKESIEKIRAGALGAGGDHQPLVARYSEDAYPVVISGRRIATLSEQWPVFVLWVEESNLEGQGGWTGLQMLEERLTEVSNRLDRLPFPIWVRRDDRKLIGVNEAYVDAVEAKNPHEVMRHTRELFSEKARIGAEKALGSGDTIRERHFGVIGGQRRAFNVIHVPLDARHALGVAIDVTGEDEALSELSRVIQAQSQTLNRLRSPVAIFGPAKTLRFFNSAFARLTGLSEDWLSGSRTHGELLDAMREKRRLPEQADYRGWRANILKQYTALLEASEEMWHLPDGTTHLVITQPHPLGGLLVLFEDITDRMALEQSYNTLIAVQQETLDNMSEAVAVVGPDGVMRLSNPAFISLWQLDEGAIVTGRRLTDLLAGLKVLNRSGVEQEALGFKECLPIWLSERVQKEGRWYRSDGHVIDFSIVPLPDGGMLLTQVDVTDSFRIEQALRERSRALEVADRLKSQFITSMSYELRTPLNSIIGFAELLDQQLFGELNDNQAAYVHDILQASNDLKSMISDVLDLAVIEAGELSLEIEHVDVVPVLNEAAILAQELAHKENMLLTVQVSDRVSTVMGDIRRLKQAFYNMVSAMLSFGRQGGALTLSLDSNGDLLTVSVVNQDCGLTPLERDQLLASVEMGGMPRSRRATGLDLALVRSIVRLHGGTVNLSPVEGEGIALTCQLPCTQKPTHVITGKKAS